MSRLRRTLRYLAGVVTVVSLFGCSGGGHLKGMVTAKQVVPAHEGTVTAIVSEIPVFHEVCYPVGKSESCSQIVQMIPVYGDVPHWFPESYVVWVTDKHGKSHKVGVSQQKFVLTEVGTGWAS